MNALMLDIRHALRAVRRNPGFAVVAVLTLALGIGANTAIFSVVNAVLLKPLPFRDADRLVTIGSSGPPGAPKGRGAMSYPDIQDVSKLTGAITGIAGYSNDRVNLTGTGEPREVQVTRAATDFFDVLGAQPVVGRGFNASETHAPVAVISHALWVSSFNGDKSALGRTVTLDGKTFTVIGVMPAGFSFPDGNTQAWVPFGWAVADAPALAATRMYRAFGTVARLAPGATLGKLNGDLQLLSQRLDAAEQPRGNGGRRVVVEQEGGPAPGGGGPSTRRARPGASPFATNLSATLLRDVVTGRDVRQPLLVLFGAVALVLLIACVNAANLLVARANTREREFAVRRAIGAGRWPIVRQLLVESVLLAFAAAAVGLVLASFGLQLLATVIPPRFAIGLNGTVLAFTILLALATGLGFGIIPALRASAPALEQSLREGTGGTEGRSRRRARDVLVVSEVALALVLLVGSGLLVRSFIRLNDVNPGFDPQGLMAARIRLTPARYATPTAQRTFFDDVVRRLSAQPGVTDITLASVLPLSGALRMIAMDPRRVNPNDSDQFLAMAATDVGPNFFSTMGVPILQGRAITAEDGQGAPLVAVVSTSLARRLWPGASPLGKVLPIGGPSGPRDVTVVGVVGEVRTGSLSDPARPAIYLPAAQGGDLQQMWIVARAAHPLRLAPVLRQVVQSEDAMQPIGEMMTYDQMIQQGQEAIRLLTTLITLFAGLALVLAVIGIAGVTAYAVSQRTRELGIRIAMGARAADVLGLLLSETVVLVGIGLGIGLVAAFGVTRTLRGILYGVASTDPVTFVGAAAALGIVALIATYVPARRAGRVDPVEALRSE